MALSALYFFSIAPFISDIVAIFFIKYDLVVPFELFLSSLYTVTSELSFFFPEVKEKIFLLKNKKNDVKFKKTKCA